MLHEQFVKSQLSKNMMLPSDLRPTEFRWNINQPGASTKPAVDRNDRQIASLEITSLGIGCNLNDLVSYDHKHNEANGEGNRDDHANSHSWNQGV
jgi:hypothetical protein